MRSSSRPPGRKNAWQKDSLLSEAMLSQLPRKSVQWLSMITLSRLICPASPCCEGSTRSVGPVFRPGTERRPTIPARKAGDREGLERRDVRADVFCRPLCGLEWEPDRITRRERRAYRSCAAFGSSGPNGSTGRADNPNTGHHWTLSSRKLSLVSEPVALIRPRAVHFICFTQKRTASGSHPSALVPAPTPNPCPTSR
jgi:hypothetical protein